MKPQTLDILNQYLARQHLRCIDELAVAFIAKHGIDPDLAQVVHRHEINETGGITIRTWIERRSNET